MSAATFTAAQIGTALGMSRSAVHRALEGIAPKGTRLVANNPAAVWRLKDLPEQLRTRLENLMRARGNIAGETLLAKARGNWWQPALPLNRIHADEIEAARRLQGALRRAVELPESSAMKERETLAATDYLAAFGRSVSDRYLRKLIARTLERDGGRRDFDRLDLYLPDSPRPISPGAGPIAHRIQFESLETHFKGCSDRGNPSAADTSYCWRGVVTFWHEQVEAGREARELREPLLEWLESTLPRLGKTRAAIARNLDRKLVAAENAGLAALLDRRAEMSGNRREVPERTLNVEKLFKLARDWRGRVAQAFRALYTGETPDGDQFTEPFRNYFSSFDPRHEKSHVPNGILAEVRRMLAATEALNMGPRAARKAGPHKTLDWSGVMSGDIQVSDDVTLNFYGSQYCEDGEFIYEGRRFNLTRGQLLVTNDLVTDFNLGRAYRPRKQYDRHFIIAQVADLWTDPGIGIPHRGVLWERGIWESLSLAKALALIERLSTGMLRLGRDFKIRHARSARGKGTLENWIGRLQNELDHVAGNCGRDERRDCPESTRRALARMKRVGQPYKADCDPAKFFLSFDQLAQEIEAAAERLNRQPMNGRRHQGTSPDEEWQKRWRGMPLVLPDALRYAIFSDSTDVRVREEGLLVKYRGAVLEYCDSAKLGGLIGETVRVKFNPATPDFVAVCHLRNDPRELHPFIVPLKQSTPAADATDEEFAAFERQRRAFVSQGEIIFRRSRPTRNATICDTNRIPAEVLASGEAHQKLEREVIELRGERSRHGAELEKVGARIGLKLDGARSKAPRADLDRARRAAEREERLRQMEAGELQPFDE